MNKINNVAIKYKKNTVRLAHSLKGGAIPTKKDKLRNRNSKESQKEKKLLRGYY